MPSRAGPKGSGGRQASPETPLDTPHPLLTRAAARDPGLGAGCCTSPEMRTLSGRGDDTARGLGEGSERLVVFRQKCRSECEPGPAEALRASSALRADGLGWCVTRTAATLRVAGLRLCGEGDEDGSRRRRLRQETERCDSEIAPLFSCLKTSTVHFHRI